MRTVRLNTPCLPTQQGKRVARLTRHLHARLLDFGPGGPEVLQADQTAGCVTVRFPGHHTAAVISRLEEGFGVSVAQEDEEARFYLTPEVPFEDLDYVWGCLFELL